MGRESDEVADSVDHALRFTAPNDRECRRGVTAPIRSPLSASARSGITNRSLIECERTTDQPIAGNVRARRQWIPSHGSALSMPPGDVFAVEAL